MRGAKQDLPRALPAPSVRHEVRRRSVLSSVVHTYKIPRLAPMARTAVTGLTTVSHTKKRTNEQTSSYKREGRLYIRRSKQMKIAMILQTRLLCPHP